IMDVNLEERAYTSPLLRYIYKNGEKVGKNSEEMKGIGFVPFSIRLSSLPIRNACDNMYMSNINSLNIINMLPLSLFSSYNSNNMSSTDILFLPKFSTFLFFTIPIFLQIPTKKHALPHMSSHGGKGEDASSIPIILHRLCIFLRGRYFELNNFPPISDSAR
ncbi:conserved Plasmodium protein, unknown function, partial [Plasmodium ovale curtisi]